MDRVPAACAAVMSVTESPRKVAAVAATPSAVRALVSRCGWGLRSAGSGVNQHLEGVVTFPELGGRVTEMPIS